MTSNKHRSGGKRLAEQGMTLIEVMVAFAISGICIAGVVYGYVLTVSSAERFALSQAANARATERLEQTRCAQWITSTQPGVDQLVATNFTNETVTLDLSGDGTVTAFATNYTTITNISTVPALRKVHVDCVWVFGVNQTVMTNSVEMIRSSK